MGVPPRVRRGFLQPPRVCISRCESIFRAPTGMKGVRRSEVRRSSAPRSVRARQTDSDQRPDLLVGRAPAQRAPQIRALCGVEAEQPDAVGGQPTPIATAAERRRRRGNDAEDRAVRQAEAIGRGGGVLRDRRDRPVVRLQPLEHLLPRDDRFHRPVRRAADIHVFDEANLGAPALCELEQVNELVLIDPADHHRVELQAGERGGGRGVDPAEDGRMLGESGERLEPGRLQGVEAHRDAMEPRRAQPGGLARQKHAVRRQREVANAGILREPFDEVRQVPAQQRLTPRQAHPIDPDLGEGAREPVQFVEPAGGPGAAARCSAPRAYSIGTAGCSGR